MFIRTWFRRLGLSLVTIFSIVLLTISYFSLREIISGTPSLSTIIPETQSLVRYPFTWHIVSGNDVPKNHLRIQPWLDRNEIIGAEISFVKDCTDDSEDCDPVKEIEKLQSDILSYNEEQNIIDQVDFGIINQMDNDNTEIYYIDVSSSQGFIKNTLGIGYFKVSGRSYVIKTKHKMFYIHTIVPRNGKYVNQFDATTDKIALSIEP